MGQGSVGCGGVRHRRRARALRAFTVKAHFVVQSGSVVHWRQGNRERKAKKERK